MKNQLWNKVMRMMAGIMMAALVVTVAQGAFRADDNLGISVLGEEPQILVVCN